VGMGFGVGPNGPDRVAASSCGVVRPLEHVSLPARPVTIGATRSKPTTSLSLTIVGRTPLGASTDESRLLAANEGLVRWDLRSIPHRPDDTDDLLQEGRLALLGVLRRYDVTRGSLASLAVPVIRGAMYECSNLGRSAIQVPAPNGGCGRGSRRA
jgi:sigma-70-like protein